MTLSCSVTETSCLGGAGAETAHPNPPCAPLWAFRLRLLSGRRPAAVVEAMTAGRGDPEAAQLAATLVRLAGRLAGRTLDLDGRVSDAAPALAGGRGLAAAAAAADEAEADAAATAEVLEALVYEWLAQVGSPSPCRTLALPQDHGPWRRPLARLAGAGRAAGRHALACEWLAPGRPSGAWHRMGLGRMLLRGRAQLCQSVCTCTPQGKHLYGESAA